MVKGIHWQYIKDDVLASVVVFLVAIPLCLGIALAAGVPLFAGVITGVIGGIVIGLLSESQVSVSGPAAGMITVIVSTISQLGSFEAFLLTLMLAGLIQVICGLLRAGFIANFVPSNVIQGLLTAIGLLIIIKQIPLAFGYYGEPIDLQSILRGAEDEGFVNLIQFIHVLKHLSVTATAITFISLIVLFFWEKLVPKMAKVIPAAVIVVAIAVLINLLLTLFIPKVALSSTHLVNIPVNGSVMGFFSHFKTPDFSQWDNLNIYAYAVLIAVVASLETLLNIEAVEQIDKYRRYTSRNRELIAQGIGNMVSGMVGGLPITSVIIRSSVNINADAKSKLSTILHGVWLLLSLSFLSTWLNHIPISALAAILIYTGFKLLRLSTIKSLYQEGFRYFIPFVVTVFAIVLTNLLLGIVIGLLISIFFILQRNSKGCLTVIEERLPSGKVLRLLLPQQVTFLNKAAIIDELNKLPRRSKVILDAKLADYIDNDILVVIKEFSEVQAKDKKILLNLEGFEAHYAVKNKTTFISATTYDVQSLLTPSMILKILQEGNSRFINNTPINKNYKQQITATAKSQYPIAVVLSCIDSRVPVEIIFDLSVGDVFVARVAGNVANIDILGSIEFACEVAGAKLIIVLGHGNCGAIRAACDDFHLGHITELVNKIKPAIALETQTQVERNSHNQTFVMNVINNNIELTKNYLYQQSEILRGLIDSHRVGLIGANYDITTGRVEFINGMLDDTAV